MRTLKLVPGLSLLLVFAAACSNSLGMEEASDKGYVVYGYSEILNYDLLEEFVQAYEQNDNAEVKLAVYTIEGDPIFHTLSYKDKQIEYTYDSRQDENGKKEKVSTSCTGLISTDHVYYLSSCAETDIGQRFRAEEKQSEK